jgi:hypothetical protein
MSKIIFELTEKDIEDFLKRDSGTSGLSNKTNKVAFDFFVNSISKNKAYFVEKILLTAKKNMYEQVFGDGD